MGLCTHSLLPFINTYTIVSLGRQAGEVVLKLCRRASEAVGALSQFCQHKLYFTKQLSTHLQLCQNIHDHCRG